MTPPELLAAAISVGLRPSCSDVMRCRLPNSTFDDVSDPVSATPSHPSMVPKIGYRNPVPANANPSVASTPEYRVVYPSAIIAEMVTRDMRTIFRVCQY